jgi:hypothetical protein
MIQVKWRKRLTPNISFQLFVMGSISELKMFTLPLLYSPDPFSNELPSPFEFPDALEDTFDYVSEFYQQSIYDYYILPDWNTGTCMPLQSGVGCECDGKRLTNIYDISPDEVSSPSRINDPTLPHYVKHCSPPHDAPLPTPVPDVPDDPCVPDSVCYRSFYTTLCKDVDRIREAVGPVPLVPLAPSSQRLSQGFCAIQVNSNYPLIVQNAKCTFSIRKACLNLTFDVMDEVVDAKSSWFDPFSRLLPSSCQRCLSASQLTGEMTNLSVKIDKRQLMELYFVVQRETDHRYGKELVVLVLNSVPPELAPLVRPQSSSAASHPNPAVTGDNTPLVLRLFFDKTPHEVETVIGRFVSAAAGSPPSAFRVTYPKLSR